jgi:hypothetical protein
MTAQELSKSAEIDPFPPSFATAMVKALWYARAGQWDAAHDFCQEVPGKAGAWIHALLHREEGDLGNADYWYSMAGRKMPSKQQSLANEWMEIASALIGK